MHRILLQGFGWRVHINRFLYFLSVVVNWRELIQIDRLLIWLIFCLKSSGLVDLINISPTVSLILNCIVSHLVSDFLFDVFENLPIYELREGIKFLLVEQCHKIVAESAHLTFPMK